MDAATAIGMKCELPAIFPWPCQTLIPKKGYGLGNPLSGMLSKNAAEPWVEQYAYVVFTNDGAGGVGGSFDLAGGMVIDMFTTGDTEAPPSNVPLPFIQNRATTNLFKKGAPVPRENLFAAIAMGVAIGRPFGLACEADVILPERLYCPWVDSYGQRARDLLFDVLGLGVAYKDGSCNVELGNISNYTPMSAPYGGDVVRLNGGMGVLSMTPICRGPVYLGATDDVSQATVQLTGIKEAITLCVDSDLEPGTCKLVVPIHVWAYGSYGPWCGECSQTPEEIDAQVDKRVQAKTAEMQRQIDAMAAAFAALKNGR